jgi:hypothetical protein
VAFGAQSTGGKGGFRCPFNKLDYAVLDVGFNAAGIIAVARTGVSKNFITAFKGYRPVGTIRPGRRTVLIHRHFIPERAFKKRWFFQNSRE